MLKTDKLQIFQSRITLGEDYSILSEGGGGGGAMGVIPPLLIVKTDFACQLESSSSSVVSEL